ncbi:MAG: cobyrinate a,c-diamide synthase, partial [Rhodomicrobium sp.]
GFDPNVEVAGVVLNRAASPRHERLARAGFDRIGLPVLGAIPRQDGISLPERHLGLVQASETRRLSECLDALADLIEAHIDVGHLLEIVTPQLARTGMEPAALSPPKMSSNLNPPGQRIALARDAAFSFIYSHLVKRWRDAGAEILPFSPLADEAPASSADVLWLPGGYPELHAGPLAANQTFLRGTRAFAANNPVHGECGGYMVLGEVLTDANGENHSMLGLLGLETSFAARKLHLGYRKAKLLSGCVLGQPGEVIAGHEFHYSTSVRQEGENLFEVTDAEGTEKGAAGLRCGKVTGSFFHAIDKWE